ncbi:uncharacterized protein C4orf45 [Nematostella vectensis]|uniref:uncharacterized protein C4orf45 n=1 Tax=Nematostella vectensis TaxID=45351 RepID=UPI002076DBD6|nr:uncharacterized protein C4orf45 [Nematostella vectensis]
MADSGQRARASNSSLFAGSDKYYNPYSGKGKILFTGPDGISDQQVSIIDPTYVGIGTMSPEGTSDLNYLWRPARRCVHPPSKSKKVGEIGWGINLFTDIKRLKSGQQIMRGEFRQECEDRHTHLYQNPWYPHPNDIEQVKKHEDEKKDSEERIFTYSSRSRRTTPDISQTSRGHSQKYYRSHTPTPRHSPPPFDGPGIRPPPRPRSCTPSTQSRARSGTMSSSTSRQSQLFS